MKQSIYILFNLILISLTTSRCNLVEETRPNVSNQLNSGFLAYHSGLLVTEGIKIVPYSFIDEKGYILLGSTDTGNDKNYFIVKTNQQGNIIWQKSYGSYTVDNIPIDIIYDELGIINILGYQFDQSISRVIPSLTTFDLEGQEIPLNIDFKSKINRDIVFEEKSTSLILYKNIGNGYRVISTIGENIDSINTANYYVADFANQITASNRAAFTFDGDNTYSVTATFTRKLGDNSFYLISSHKNSAGLVYNSFLRYEIQLDGSTIQTGGWTYKSQDNEAIIADCEVLEGSSAGDLILLSKDKENQLISTIVQLTVLDNWSQGNLFTIPDNNINTKKYGKIALDSKATISKIDNSQYFIAASRLDDHALMLINIPDINQPDNQSWATDWNGSYEFNNISASNRFKHVRNNVGNVIKSHQTDEYCVVGTHDFLDVTKMIMMQLDENGQYIRSTE